jgi:hypothetical protein
MPTMDPIQIKSRNAGRQIEFLQYFSAGVAKIKTISGRRWPHGKKYWTIPSIEGMHSHSSQACFFALSIRVVGN